jgi:phosphatidylinositol glycan class H protein
MRTLGVQTSTSSSTYLGTATTRFIPTSQIQDIFIHEAFIGFEVRYYLAIVVDGEDDVTVVFPVSEFLCGQGCLANGAQNLLPKLAIVEEVWRGTRNCLFESKPKPPKDYR